MPKGTLGRAKANACEHTNRIARAFGLCSTCYHRNWQRNRPREKVRAYWNLITYGLSPVERKQLEDKQGNVCAVCGLVSVKRPLDIDHDHVTGYVRGLLCRKCNTALGLFQDDINRLQKAIQYLTK